MENITERQPVIQIKGLKKRYRMGTIGSTTLKADWESFWAKRKGKEDPNAIVGQERLVGKTFMALNGVDLTIHKGETVGIIGVNGAGKSTLLKIISRITAPSAGEIRIRGKIASMLEVGTGFNPDLTGRENIYLNGTILGMTRKEVDEKIEEIIDFSECRSFIDTPVKRYSSGMYVKLAFSVSAHLDSDIMIMDEVLAVGDVKFQKKCLGRMSEAANSEGKTVLYVSHNMSTIRQICTRCVVLKDGKVIFDGDVEEAIKIYSEESLNMEMKRTFEQPEVYPPHQLFAIKSIEALDAENLILSPGHKLKLRITYNGLGECKDEAFIVSHKYAGANITGTHISKHFDLTKGDDQSLILEIDTTTMSVGRYYFDISAGQVSSERFILHDSIQNAFAFQITESDRQQGLRWLNGKWGYNVLEPMTVTKE